MKKLLALAFVLILFCQYLSAQVSLFPYGSSWKYLDNGTNQGTAWRATSFNDEFWKTGKGKFGFGIPDASTLISFGPDRKNKYITTYFRKKLNLSNPALYSSFVAKVKRDDGIVVYINGTEVFRNNMPAGVITYTTQSVAEALDNGLTDQQFIIPVSSFIAGDNIIAVEIHQQKSNNGEMDMVFDGNLLGTPNAPPVVLSINRLLPLSPTTAASTISFRVQFSEAVTGVDATDFILTTGTGVSGIISPTLVNTGPDYYDVTINSITGSGPVQLDLKPSGTNITDLSNLAISGGYTNGQSFTIDQTAPVVSLFNKLSPTGYITSASTLVYRINFSEPVSGVDVSDFNVSLSGSAAALLAADAVSIVGTQGTAYDVSITSVSGEGTVQLNINENNTDIQDAVGNVIANGTVNGPIFSVTGIPVVISINRQLPAVENTTETSVTWRITFSEPVVGVDASDFIANAVSGNVRGTLAFLAMENAGTSGSESITRVDAEGTTYDIQVRALAGTGNLRLDLRTNNGIMDTTGIPVQGGFLSGQSYQVNVTSAFSSFSDLTPIPISSHTAEKPQSKVWNYAGKWWTVLATTTGTKIFRLDGSNWTAVLTLGPSTNSKADCIISGNLVHILLFRGGAIRRVDGTFQQANSFLYSVEYDVSISSYKLWTLRTARATINFEEGAKTATMVRDENGRLWVANDGTDGIYLRYSDATYATWSAPYKLVTGIMDDDISALVSLPGKIGIMWSNQNNQRFGFQTHITGAEPFEWTPDEVPAGASALNIKLGMADDHIQMVTASDGTVYAAVKTGYETLGQPKVALLVRHPDGIWDPLHPVTANEGTRPIVVLNELNGKLKVIYSSHEQGGDILYRESSTTAISFGAPTTLFGGNPAVIYNFVTSVNRSYSSELVIMATNMTTGPNDIYAVSVLVSENGTASAPSVTAANSVRENRSVHLHSSLQLSPNPVTSTAVLNFTLPEAGAYSLSLYNSLGVRIKVISRGNALPNQTTRIPLNAAALGRGVYIVTLETSSGFQSLKIVKN